MNPLQLVWDALHCPVSLNVLVTILLSVAAPAIAAEFDPLQASDVDAIAPVYLDITDATRDWVIARKV